MPSEKLPSVAGFRLDSFRHEMMDEAISGGMLDHTRLAAGRFLASMLSAHLGENRLEGAA